MKKVLMLPLLIVMLAGYAASMQAANSEPASIQYIDGVVQQMEGNSITVSLKLPEVRKTGKTAVAEIAQQVIQKGLFITGMNVDVDVITGSVGKIIGNTVSIVFEKPPPFVVRTNVKVKIPKKKIAITDFTVIRGGIKEAGSMVMEGLSTALIESGHFAVLERSELQTILKEVKLSQSGLFEEIPEKARLKLLIADLILTGTLAEIGNNYEINLRIWDVRTGQAMSAISITTPLFKLVEMRDAGEWTVIDYSWQIGPTDATGFVTRDNKIGVQGSMSSLRLDYDFQGLDSKKEIKCPNMKTTKKRDLSLFKGVEFYAKATEPLIGIFNIDISDRDDHNVRNRWLARYEIKKEWTQVKIPFDQVRVIKSKTLAKEGYKSGRQILDVSNVETLLFGTCNNLTGKESKGSMWIDNIHFYK